MVLITDVHIVQCSRVHSVHVHVSTLILPCDDDSLADSDLSEDLNSSVDF